jgi:peptidoglycan/xylan/chitin deacetylase (PgdA/CDA1 family)
MAKAFRRTKKIALTFDDGPNPLSTPQILNILEKKKIKATFFIIGDNAKKYPELLKKIYKDGHEIELHSNSHSRLLPLFFKKAIRAEIEKNIKIIKKQINFTPSYFRPPWGRSSPWMTNEIKKMNLKIALWSIDLKDWSGTSPEKMLKMFEKKIKPGGIILLHDGEGKKKVKMENTIKALPKIIDLAKARGYHFVTLNNS